MHSIAPITLPLNLPENPTIADVIHVLSKCDPTKLAFDEVYRPLTAIVLDSKGDAVFSALPRVNPEPRRTLSAIPAAELIEEFRS